MRVLGVSAIIVIADQITKILVKGISIPSLGIHVNGLPYGFSRPLLGNLVRLTYIENPGMAFGIDVGGKLFFSIFSVVASIAIVIFLYHARKDALGFRISLALILGGAIGNLIDRVFYGVVFHEGPLFYGRVVDFVDVDFFDLNLFGHQLNRWPVFNVADAAVTIGVVLLIVFHRKVISSEQAAGADARVPAVDPGVTGGGPPVPHDSPPPGNPD